MLADLEKLTAVSIHDDGLHIFAIGRTSESSKVAGGRVIPPAAGSRTDGCEETIKKTIEHGRETGNYIHGYAASIKIDNENVPCESVKNDEATPDIAGTKLSAARFLRGRHNDPTR